MMSLADAIISEDLDQLHAILSFHPDINELDEYGFTPLIEGAIVNNTEICRLLIERGADVNLQDSIGGTPLHWAAENNNLSLCELLLSNGANPNTYNVSGQPILVMPLLRQQRPLQRLLISAGANLDFAQDFINIKLLGHLYELVGTANIVDPYNEFVEIDFEGFFLEVTLPMIAESIAQYKSHFAGRQIRKNEQLTSIIIDVLYRAAELIKYQQYQVNIQKYESKIASLIKDEPVIIPIGYEGHAITFVKFKTILVKCDRREESRLYDNIFFYRIGNPDVMSVEFIKNLIYEKQSHEFINDQLPNILALQPLTELKIPAQISGNCSWANVEACIPVLFFLLFSRATDFINNMARYKSLAINYFNQWREWNKDRALNFFIQSYQNSDSIRKACKAEILAAILFQCCSEPATTRENERIEKILSLFNTPQGTQLLLNYVKSYYYEDQSEEGKNFVNVLKARGFLEIG